MSEPVKWWRKTTIANVVSAACTLAALAFAIWQKNVDLVTFIGGAAIGYLFGQKAKK